MGPAFQRSWGSQSGRDPRGPHRITTGSSEGAPKGMEAVPYLKSEDRGPERPVSAPESPSKRGAELNGNTVPDSALPPILCEG